MKGWLRLWVFTSLILVLGAVSLSAYYVVGVDSCYRIISVTAADNANAQDRALVQSIQTTQNVYCGADQRSGPLTIEDLAKRGAVTQVAFEWREPNGWVLEKRDMLDLVGGNEITASTISDRAIGYVRNARLAFVERLLGVIAAGCFVLLALGYGVAWVKRGFGRKGGRDGDAVS